MSSIHWSDHGYVPRTLHLNESEVAQGLPRNFTDGFDLTPAQCLRMIGNALNLWMMWPILRNYRPSLSRQAIPIRYISVFHSTLHTSPTSFPNTSAGADAYAEMLNAFDDAALFSYFHQQCSGSHLSSHFNYVRVPDRMPNQSSHTRFRQG